MKKRVISLFLALSILCALGFTALAAEEDIGFSDVPTGVWYAEAANYVRDNRLMSGTTATTFSPDTTTSRAMLVTILYRQAASPAAQPATFFDVATNAWYSNAVGWAAANGIISGYSDGSFVPDAPVTREQLATILWRVVGTPATHSSKPFSDQSTISTYALNSVSWAQSTGIMSGRSGNRFDPQSSATRAELAVMLQRWLTADTPAQPESASDILVVWFSHTGNTKAVAETVAQLTGGDLFELVPTTPYPTEYDDALTQARQELNSNARPVLSNHNRSMDSYDTIYLGFPIWHGNTPMIIRTFLEEYDFSSKTIAPFSTSGSSGIDTAVSAIRTLCPESKVTAGLSIPSDSLSRAERLVDSWIKRINAPSGSSDGGGTSSPSVPNPPSSTTPTPDPDPDLGENEDTAMPKLSIQIGSTVFTATLEDNATTRALVACLPMTITMGELNGNEKYYYLPSDLPSNSQRPGTIHAGDLMLYGSNCMVLFYETFSSAYSYTRLGSIDAPAGLTAALGGNSVELTITVVR